ncbi:Sgf73p [Rhizophagus irregularis DAOM 197198w]|uniref:Sgf73p n=1 Tax=Rhizophagus irregularis (strain DAOM 197198w) TaxID=1432141 RepID=A0A015JJP7_RHIIW|nr:Sgf73p [Rhizophagus irregularis DAOM 197198w]EXX69697.1 Sgf73p [Rhizophagus irregularis DAOM 197198w]EXX69700.1 Sgf73p [Rhizophagus irregularis DAOM 197198w]PKY15090.1 SCA7-domain-containing protein [Rhizophagus irregularis]
MDQGWKSLISTDSLSVFNKEEDNWELPTFRVPSDVPTLEEPVTDPSSWKELKDATLNEDYDNEEDAVLASNGELSVPPSTASRLNYYDMKTYGCKPLKDESGIVNCNECSKKVLPRGFIDHSANCEKIKAEALEAQNVDIPTEVSNADLTVNKNTKNSTTETHNSNKKRKKSVEAEITDTKRPNSPIAKASPEKKQKTKKEKEKKKTTGRHKGPIDLDKQCGVIVPPNNTPCTRSLTCKSHSMALKRGVLGRSQSYDILLAQYQKKSIGRPQNNGVPNNKQDNTKKDGKVVVPEKEEEVVDSEEEVDAVMEAIMYSNPRPLVTRSTSYVPQRSNYFIYNDINEILPKGVA